MITIRPAPALTPHELNALRERIRANIVTYPVTWLWEEDMGPDWAQFPCWIYQGKWQDGKGFKKMRVKGRGQYVHRMSFLAHGKEIPPGHVLDHLCRRRGCCQPEHLDPVLTAVNTERGNGKHTQFSAREVDYEFLASVETQGRAEYGPLDWRDDADLLAAHIDHGDPRFSVRGDYAPLETRVIVQEMAHTTRAETFMPLTQGDFTVTGRMVPAEAMSTYPRRLRQFFKWFWRRAP